MAVRDLLFVIIGVVAIGGAFYEWKWVMDHRKSEAIETKLGGRQRTRIAYFMVGAVLAALGLLESVGFVYFG